MSVNIGILFNLKSQMQVERYQSEKKIKTRKVHKNAYFNGTVQMSHSNRHSFEPFCVLIHFLKKKFKK